MTQDSYSVGNVLGFGRTNRIDETVIAHDKMKMIATDIGCRIVPDGSRVIIKHFLADFVGCGLAAAGNIAFLASTACRNEVAHGFSPSLSFNRSFV